MDTKEIDVLVKDMIAAMAEVAKPLVEAIEAMPETTRGRYGAYMNILSRIAVRCRGQGLPDDVIVMALSAALINAGANRYGVTWATHILGYGDGVVNDNGLSFN